MSRRLANCEALKFKLRRNSKGTQMKEIVRTILPVALLALGVGGFLAFGSRRPLATQIDKVKAAPLVTTVPVKAHKGGLDIRVDGVVVPYREVQLAAEVSGRITKKADVCNAGWFVEKGTLLFEIDPRDYDLEIRRFEQEFRQAEISIKELDVEIENTEALLQLAEDKLKLQLNEMARLEKLSGKNYVTDSQLDQERQNVLAARNAMLTLRNQKSLLTTRRSRLESAKEFAILQREKALLDRMRAEVRSPINGVVIEDSVELDAYVNKGAPLVTIEDTSKVEVKCSLRMGELYWIWRQPAPTSVGREPSDGYRITKTPATVVFELGSRKYAWDGVLSRYDGIGVDEKTRTVPCRITIDNPRDARVLGNQAKPGTWSGPPAMVRGMFVTVIVHAKPDLSLLAIPERAVQPGSKVWKVENGKLQILKVHVVEIQDDGTVLVHPDKSDLLAGDELITSPMTAPKNGMPVETKRTPLDQRIVPIEKQASK